MVGGDEERNVFGKEGMFLGGKNSRNLFCRFKSGEKARKKGKRFERMEALRKDMNERDTREVGGNSRGFEVMNGVKPSGKPTEERGVENERRM
mgnify:CR=1 FL=1